MYLAPPPGCLHTQIALDDDSMPRSPHPTARRSAALAVALVTVLAAPVACGPRQVAVRTGESPAAESSIEFTNNLTTAVNVYVRPNSGAGELFLRQVAAQTTETIPVRGVSPGTS